MSDQNDPKILVKKADGSYVHVPLSELKKKTQPKSVAAVSAAPANLPVANEKPKNIEPQKKSEPLKNSSVSESERLEKEIPMVIKTDPKPVIKPIQKPESNVRVVTSRMNIPTPKAQQKVEVKSEKSDFSSLLDEKLPTPSKITPLTSSGREKQIDAVLQNLNFKIPAGNSSRLRTIIQLFLKEVRGENDTIEILRRPEIEGGMGLSVEQAKEVVEKCRHTVVPTESIDKIPALKVKPVTDEATPKTEIKKSTISNQIDTQSRESARLEKELPMISKNDIRRNVSEPAKPIEPKKEVPKVENPSRKTLEDQVTKATLADAPFDVFKLNSNQSRTSMHDVKANPVEMGPVEEIRYFSLADFRRLSTDPTEAANRLKQKFLNLREESILLYFEAWDAWKSSPLFHDYLKIVSDSLSKRVPLIRVATDKTQIQPQEIYALVRMEKQLG